MASTGYFFILIAFFITCLNSVMAIKCFTCNSKQEPRCKDPFQGPAPGLEPVDCSQDQQQRQHTKQAIEEVLNLMTKLGQAPVPVSPEQPISTSLNDTIPMACQKLELEVLGERVTGRGCSSKPLGFYRPCDAIKVITNNEIVLHYCSLCEEDGCNGSWRTRWEPWTIFLLIILSF